VTDRGRCCIGQSKLTQRSNRSTFPMGASRTQLTTRHRHSGSPAFWAPSAEIRIYFLFGLVTIFASDCQPMGWLICSNDQVHRDMSDRIPAELHTSVTEALGTWDFFLVPPTVLMRVSMDWPETSTLKSWESTVATLHLCLL